jgi:phage I-like protein
MSKGASTHSKHTRQAVAVLTVSLSPGAELVQLTPDGVFRARDGRPKALPGWKIDRAIALRVLSRVHARKTPIVVDYEHQTLLADENGQPAPAAGWIEPLSVQYREGEGFFAPVKWTSRAQSMIEGDEYKFISPVLPYDPKTGEVLDIIHIALTNNPAVDGMAPVAALSSRYDLDPATTEETDTVERKELIKLLGLADDATDAQILVALKAATGAQAALAALRTELNLDENGDASAAIAALKGSATAAGKPDPAQYAPISVVTELQQQVAALKAKTDDGEKEDLINEGIEAGKLMGDEHVKWARTLDVAALKSYLDKAPAIAALKATQTGGKKPAGTEGDDTQLDDVQLAVCKQLGIDPAEYKKTLAASAA